MALEVSMHNPLRDEINRLKRIVQSFYCNTFLIVAAVILTAMNISHTILMKNQDIYNTCALIWALVADGLFLITCILAWVSQKTISFSVQISSMVAWFLSLVPMIGFIVYVEGTLIAKGHDVFVCNDCTDPNDKWVPYSIGSSKELTVSEFLELSVMYVYLPIQIILRIWIFLNAGIILFWLYQIKKITPKGEANNSDNNNNNNDLQYGARQSEVEMPNQLDNRQV